MPRIIGLVLIVALTIAASLAASFRDTLWAGYRDYVSPYLAELPAGPPRPALSGRIVVVLVRGLRLDASRQMPTLNELRQRGADVTLMLDTPTYRLPRWLTLASGASADTHGVTNNYPARLGSVDTFIREAQLNGQNTAVIGSQQLADVFGAGAGRYELIEGFDMNDRDDLAITATLTILNDPVSPASVVLTELGMLEEAARFGQRGYDIAVSATDQRIRALAGAIDLRHSTLVIVSDRGLIFGPRGSTDGGDETEVARAPLVMAGAGIKPATQALISAVDVAPTLAALSGAPIPVHAQGQIALQTLNIPAAKTLAPLPANQNPISGTAPLTGTASLTDTAPLSATAPLSGTSGGTLSPVSELLWASATQLATFYENWSEAAGAPRFASESLRLFEGRIKNGEVAAYQSFAMSVTAQAQAERESRLTGGRAQRLPVLIGASLLLISVMSVVIGRRLWRPLAGMVLYLLVWYAFVYFVRGYRLSLSMFADSNPADAFATFGRDSAISIGIVCLLMAATTGQDDDGLEAISTVMNTLALILFLQLAGVMWFAWQWDVDYTWALPASSMLMVPLIVLSQISALSIQVLPNLPNLPLPLATAVATLIVYAFARQRLERRRQAWWR